MGSKCPEEPTSEPTPVSLVPDGWEWTLVSAKAQDGLRVYPVDGWRPFAVMQTGYILIARPPQETENEPLKTSDRCETLDEAQDVIDRMEARDRKMVSEIDGFIDWYDDQADNSGSATTHAIWRDIVSELRLLRQPYITEDEA